jgi:hypothetical protein
MVETVLGLAILIPLARSGVGWWILGAVFVLVGILDYLFVPFTPADRT